MENTNSQYRELFEAIHGYIEESIWGKTLGHFRAEEQAAIQSTGITDTYLGDRLNHQDVDTILHALEQKSRSAAGEVRNFLGPNILPSTSMALSKFLQSIEIITNKSVPFYDLNIAIMMDNLGRLIWELEETIEEIEELAIGK